MIDKTVDIGVTVGEYRSDLSSVIDYTDFVSINAVMFKACGPQTLKGTFNILRPFGYVKKR